MQLLLIIPFVFLFFFLIAPLVSLLFKAISLGLLGVAAPILSEELTWSSFFTTFNLALVVVLGALFIAVILSFLLIRFKIPGSSLLRFILILPIIVPPFVTGIGIRKLFARFGPINLSCLKLGIINQPIDWLGLSGFSGVAIAEIIHYYPIILLSLLASANALDYSLIQAAQLSGANRGRLFREILLPQFLPSSIASLALVFAWSFTELGTPLVFDYRNVLAVKLFTSLDDLHTNPRGYVYVMLVLVVSVFASLIAQQLLGNRNGLQFSTRGALPIPKIEPSKYIGGLLLLAIILAACFFLLPQISIFILSISGRWNMTILPEIITSENLSKLFFHPLVFRSIAISTVLAASSCILLFVLSAIIVFIKRGKSKLGQFLGKVSNISLIIPGVVLAYSFLETFRSSLIDPRVNPIVLLVAAYGIRRLPLVITSFNSALSVSSQSLEEAARVCGSSPLRVFKNVTLPLAIPFVVSAMILSFVFAMFEVSESLMLAQQEKYFPISKTMYALLNRPDGPGMACALGVMAFFAILMGILAAARFSGRRFEELFRIT